MNKAGVVFEEEDARLNDYRIDLLADKFEFVAVNTEQMHSAPAALVKAVEHIQGLKLERDQLGKALARVEAHRNRLIASRDQLLQDIVGAQALAGELEAERDQLQAEVRDLRRQRDETVWDFRSNNEKNVERENHILREELAEVRKQLAYERNPWLGIGL